jgi:hypothetical protein
MDRRKFLEAINSVPPSIFRVNGIIDLSDPQQTMLLQYVAGRYDLSDFPNPPTRDRFMTPSGKALVSPCMRFCGRARKGFIRRRAAHWRSTPEGYMADSNALVIGGGIAGGMLPVVEF